jgi:hypothetical protein
VLAVTGNGLIVSGRRRRAVVEYCVAHDNGADRQLDGGRQSLDVRLEQRHDPVTASRTTTRPAASTTVTVRPRPQHVQLGHPVLLRARQRRGRESRWRRKGDLLALHGQHTMPRTTSSRTHARKLLSGDFNSRQDRQHAGLQQHDLQFLRLGACTPPASALAGGTDLKSSNLRSATTYPDDRRALGRVDPRHADVSHRP